LYQVVAAVLPAEAAVPADAAPVEAVTPVNAEQTLANASLGGTDI